VKDDYEPLDTTLRVGYEDGSVVEGHSKEPSGEPGNPMKFEGESTLRKENRRPDNTGEIAVSSFSEIALS
jgi:hypothetical protein